MVEQFLAKCQGRWYSILRAAGIGAQFLRNVHGPCPLCEGKDRFRWDDKDGRGTFFCSSCGAGDGLKLYQLYTGADVKTAIKDIEPDTFEKKAGEPARPADAAGKRIRKILAESKPLSDISGGVVRKYLTARGVKASPALREHPGLKYFSETGAVLGTYPAMVSLISDGHSVASLHITYLSEDGGKAPVPSPKKILTPVRPMDGMSIRLTKPYEELGVAEGIETALAAMGRHSTPCWACGTAGMLEKFVWPPGTKMLYIFGDHDESFTCQKAAYTLACRAKKAGLAVTVLIPDSVGDFADEAGRGLRK